MMAANIFQQKLLTPCFAVLRLLMDSDISDMQTTSIVLPEPLLAQLREIAKAEGRSVSSQVRIFLADAVTRKNTEDADRPDPDPDGRAAYASGRSIHHAAPAGKEGQ